MKKELLLIIIVFVLVLITSCENAVVSPLGIKKTPKLGGNDSQETFKIVAISPETEIPCEERAKRLIPNDVELITSPLNDWKIELFRWLDGTNLESSNEECARFRRGSGEGENGNHYYMYKESDDNCDYLEYKKPVADEKGTISGYNNFKVNLILALSEKEPETTIGKRFDVVDYSIISCNWSE